ncbi:GTPase activating protein [Coemansia biformis]|uniref:GTPase activating protein n=1 Tax=Coemansia biformis TaxID=1286918 RepID=A0A9W7YAY2_9FUNG|nr:GTPase activating protein [Coemansia biformis]
MGGAPVDGTPPSELSDYCIVSEVALVRLLYSRSKVYVYRSADKKDRISGFICVVQGPDDQYYIAWTPEALLSEHDRESYVQVELCPSASVGSPSASTTEVNLQASLALYSDDEYALVSTGPLSSARSISSVASYAFCKPVGEVLSLLIHPPTLTHWYGSLILNLADGSSLAPMWFHDDECASSMLGMARHWGGDDLLVWLSHAVDIERSTSDPNRYEIRGTKTAHVSLSRQTTPAASTLLPGPPKASTSAQPATDAEGAGTASGSAADVLDSALSGNMDPLMDQVKELRWGILERFSRITQTVRDAATSFIETPVGRQVVPFIPPSLGGLGRAQSASESLVKEYEGARIYLAKWAAQHIISQQHEDGERESQLAAGAADPGTSGDASHGAGRPGGQGHMSVWEEWVAENGDLGSFEVVSTDKTANLPRPIRTQPPLTAERWFEFFEPADGGTPNAEFRLVASPDAVRRAVFAGGVEEDMRPLVWKYLLGIYPWASSEAERKAIDKAKADEYWILKDKWLSDPELKKSADHAEQSCRIEKDVLRTDRTLPLFATDSVFGGSDEANLSEHGLPGSSASLEKMKDILMTFHYYEEGALGYVQGMSDLLAPVYSVYQDEPTTFWAFAMFMKRMRTHFLRDQSGMQDELDTMAQLVEIANPRLHQHLEQCDASNMFCCYRWLLIWFKREFGFEDILRLWEVLWTDYLTERFVLFVALAILQRHADVIMDHLRSPEEVLKYVQDLSDTIDLNDALKGAEMCYYKTRYRVEAVERIRAERNLPPFVDSAEPAQAAGAAGADGEETGSEEAGSEAPLIALVDDDTASESSICRTPHLAGADGLQPELALPQVSKAVHELFASGFKP